MSLLGFTDSVEHSSTTRMAYTTSPVARVDCYGRGMINPSGASLPRLVEIMERLLAPDGCPWDREQTLETLRPFLIEETYEVLDAMSRGDVPGHREELGDLLMQIVFQS